MNSPSTSLGTASSPALGSTGRLVGIASAYMTMKEGLLETGYANEIDWQFSRRWSEVTESEFLMEAAWVVLTCGFRESVVRARWHSISDAFADWESANAIVQHEARCVREASHVFSNNKKLAAIVEIARTVSQLGFSAFVEKVSREGLAALDELPFMGPATSRHLAKNVGLPHAKPDRHLVRAAKEAGFSSPEELCGAISQIVGDPVEVVDIVIWRYATIHSRSRARLFEHEAR